MNLIKPLSLSAFVLRQVGNGSLKRDVSEEQDSKWGKRYAGQPGCELEQVGHSLAGPQFRQTGKGCTPFPAGPGRRPYQPLHVNGWQQRRASGSPGSGAPCCNERTNGLCPGALLCPIPWHKPADHGSTRLISAPALLIQGKIAEFVLCFGSICLSSIRTSNLIFKLFKSTQLYPFAYMACHVGLFVTAQSSRVRIDLSVVQEGSQLRV